MSERLSSTLILVGAVLVVLALWYLSVLVVRWDTRRRRDRQEMREWERKAWVSAAIFLPLFGFALYIFWRVLRRYLVPPPAPPAEDSIHTAVRLQPLELDLDEQHPLPDTGATVPHTNGKAAAAQATKLEERATPATVPAAYQALRARYGLVVVQGPHSGILFTLDRMPVRIGRGPDVELALDTDLNISRRHAEIYEWNGMLRIRDLGSTHGTHINGSPVTDQALSPGDRIAVGGTVFLLRELG